MTQERVKGLQFETWRGTGVLDLERSAQRVYSRQEDSMFNGQAHLKAILRLLNFHDAKCSI